MRRIFPVVAADHDTQRNSVGPGQKLHGEYQARKRPVWRPDLLGPATCIQDLTRIGYRSHSTLFTTILCETSSLFRLTPDNVMLREHIHALWLSSQSESVPSTPSETPSNEQPKNCNSLKWDKPFALTQITDCRPLQLLDWSSCAFGPVHLQWRNTNDALGDVYRRENLEPSYLGALSPQVSEALLCPVQATSSSVGVNPIQVDNGPIKVLKAHMMLSTFGVVNDKEAGTMTHAHTFGGR